ncbi:hypothetical protein [Lapidilactobacillus luobeiensis]|uniref:hypothetical protein n=1 Tax=Lapidilactobacillus luobeiensis TaxID=2950371 RepID=UPI0021C3F8C1|nr:hypothetical protein [Lapidilactobacillus luobeiensis]
MKNRESPLGIFGFLLPKFTAKKTRPELGVQWTCATNQQFYTAAGLSKFDKHCGNNVRETEYYSFWL